MAHALDIHRNKTETRSNVYSRDGILSWYLMVAGAGLMAITAALSVLFLVIHLSWAGMRRPQGGMGAVGQVALLSLSLALSGGVALLLARWADVVSLAPVLSRVVWTLPIVLIVVLGIAARMKSHRLLSPERGVGRSQVGLLHQVLPNTLLVVVLAYVALAVPTALMRHQMTAMGWPYVLGDKQSDFRKEMGWDEAKVRHPFAAAVSRESRSTR
jgi:hypothetical protein